jgi:23S rRNA (cytosine1962-C5)-methyltransferase
MPVEERAPFDYPVLRLRPGREFAAQTGHPWLFSGAFEKLPDDLPPGSVADVTTNSGEWVARGHLNAKNGLAFRVLTREAADAIDEDFYLQRIQRALRLRALLPAEVNAYRVVNAEADFLPGLIVDRFDRWLVAQFHTAGVERQREMIVAALRRALEPEGLAGILARDDIRVREREGLAAGGASVAWGEVPETIEIREHGVRYLVDPWAGQKTGFFLDQRDKRRLVGELARSATTLLNCFSYTGGFALAALAGNSALRTVNVDASGAALELARRNYALNGHDPEAHVFHDSDVSRYLPEIATTGQRFDVVVVDPPAFAKNLGMKERALRGYETLNMNAARATSAEGLLLTCSCSGAVDLAEFEAAVRQGLLRAGRTAQLVTTFGPSLDHPTLPGFPEDRYLKALLFRLL